MIKVVEFKKKEQKFTMLEGKEYYDLVKAGKIQEGQIIKRPVKDSMKSAIDGLNEYLQQNDKEIDLIEIQTHTDSFVLVYRVVTDENRELINMRWYG